MNIYDHKYLEYNEILATHNVQYVHHETFNVMISSLILLML